MSIFADSLETLEALQEAGIPTWKYQGVNDWEQVTNLLEAQGYKQLPNKMWTKGKVTLLEDVTETITNKGAIEIATGAVETTEQGHFLMTVGGEAASSTATAAGTVSEAAGALVASPKAMVITAVGALAGFTIGFDTGQYLYSKFFGDDDFDWGTDSVGGKVLTYLNPKTGETYLDDELVERIRLRLKEIGAFDSGETEKTDYYIDGWINNASNMGIKEYVDGLNNIRITLYQSMPRDTALSMFNELLRLYPSLESYRGLFEFKFSWEGSSSTRTYKLNLTTTNSNNMYIGSYYDGVSRYINYPLTNNYPDWCNKSTTNSNFYYIYTKTNSYTKYHIELQGVTFKNITAENNDGLDLYLTPPNMSRENFKGYGINLSNIYTNFGLKSGTGGIPGISKEPGATYADDDTPLREKLPEWFNNKKEYFAGDEENPQRKKIVVPVSIPQTPNPTEPQPEPLKQEDTVTGKSPRPSIQGMIKDVEQIQVDLDIPFDTTEKIDTEDDGETTPTPPPTIGVDGIGLVALYNPTQAELANFSRFLWSDDFVTNIKKLFQDPMEAIIGLHMIYKQPEQGSRANIICGYIDSLVNTRTISSQYISFSCGTKKVNQYFGNVLDFAPYTQVKLFLPFIGFVDLDTNEVMNSSISILYKVDVLTGDTLAEVRILKNNLDAILYTYNGNCAVQMPISASNYSAMLKSTVAGFVGGAVRGGVVGGAVGGLAGAAASGVSIQHSGNIQGNAGALGQKKPYLVITRSKPYMANNFETFQGKPINKTVTIGDCVGFTKFKEVHLEGIHATSDELEEIETLLMEGVII